MTSGEIADKRSLGVVQIAVRQPEVTGVRLDKLHWKTVTETGVLVSKDGMIFTNPVPLWNEDLHWAASDVVVRLYSRGGHFKEVPGMVVNVDYPGGAAIVRISSHTKDLEPVPIGDSDHLRRGQPVTLVSRDVGEMTSAGGELSEIVYGYDDTSKQDRVFGLRTTAVSPLGTTGNGLFDAEGRLIGILGEVPGAGAPDKASTYGQCVGLFIGHAGSADVWLDSSEWANWLGITGMTVSPTVAKNLQLPVAHGVLLQGVVAGSPAARAGIRGSDHVITSSKAPGYPQYVAGDVIVSIDGSQIRNFDDVHAVLKKQQPGRPFIVDLYRDGRPLSVRVTVPKRPWWS
jgi:S1-C subfamily serine protease